MQNSKNKVLTVQDLSCAGQCSLSVALPILSAFGLETCVLPTAILSEHTMFQNFTFLDLAQNMLDTLDSWKKDNHRFHAVYTGYLGRNEHFAIVEDAIRELSEENALVVVDPVFGDNGKLYPLFNTEYVDKVRSFMKNANVILPNITEACYLTGREYKAVCDKAEAAALIAELTALGDFDIVLTGVDENGKIGFACYDKNTKKTEFYFAERLKGSFHGTGDIFASVFMGAYLSGKSLFESSKAAAQFVAASIQATEDGHTYGVQFEKILAEYAHKCLQK